MGRGKTIVSVLAVCVMLGLALEGMGTAARNQLTERLGLSGEESLVAEGVAGAGRLAGRQQAGILKSRDHSNMLS